MHNGRCIIVKTNRAHLLEKIHSCPKMGKMGPANGIRRFSNQLYLKKILMNQLDDIDSRNIKVLNF